MTLSVLNPGVITPVQQWSRSAPGVTYPNPRVLSPRALSLNPLVVGTGLFSDGTVTAPSIAFSSEPGTGLWKPAAGALAISVSGAESARFVGKHLGFSATPPSLQDQSAPMLYMGDGALGVRVGYSLVSNAYLQSGVWKAIAAGYSIALTTSSGFFFYTSTSAAGAGSNVDFTERVRFDSAGYVGIGGVGATHRLTVQSDGATTPAAAFMGQGDTNRRVYVGYNSTSEYGTIRAVKEGTGNQPLVLNESGGRVCVGTVGSSRNNCDFQIVNSIGFPSTQVASTDVNALDHYEEGTFTPSITAAIGSFTSITGVVGEYTKIGNRVLWYVEFTITTNGTADGYAVASGFPFTFGNNHEGNGRESAALGYQLQAEGNATGSSIIIVRWDNAFPTDRNNGRLIRCNGQHRV